MTIIATIIGSDTCTAEGITVRAAAPVLAMCRKLIEAGYDPALPLHAYRGDVLCLKIKSIGEGAKWTVADRPSGQMGFVKWTPPPSNKVGTARSSDGEEGCQTPEAAE
jgi:hypothetical protein